MNDYALGHDMADNAKALDRAEARLKGLADE